MNEASNAFVIALGMGTVFFGLICIVFLCMAMSWIIKKFQKDDAEKAPAAGPAPTAAVQNAPIADRQAIIAGTCAVIAEELGTDVKNIKVVSFKRV